MQTPPTVYYVMQDTPPTKEPERRSGNHKLVLLALIAGGAYLIYKTEQETRRQDAERLHKRYGNTYKDTI